MGRDIQAIKFSGEDRRKYREKVRRSLDVFARMLRERWFEAKPAQVGQEIELNLVDASGMPSMRSTQALEAIADPAWATEVGQFNLEINVPPRGLSGDSLAVLEEEVRGSLNAGDEKAAGAAKGASLPPASVQTALLFREVYAEPVIVWRGEVEAPAPKNAKAAPAAANPAEQPANKPSFGSRVAGFFRRLFGGKQKQQPQSAESRPLTGFWDAL